MTKEVGEKPERPNPLGIPDLIKPEGWQAPSHEGNHGLIPNSHKGQVQEEIWIKEQKEKELKENMLKANKARTEISGKHNTRWTPNAIEEYDG